MTTVRSKGRAKLWAYGYAELAEAMGTTVQALRAKAHRGTLGFDPGDLVQIARVIGGKL